MSRHRTLRSTAAIAALLAGTIGMAGCGGGGASTLASTPPPMPVPSSSVVGTSLVVQRPLAAAPAWTTGTYEGVAVFRNVLTGAIGRAPAGSVSLAVDTAGKTYSLTVTAGSVSVAPVTFSTLPRVGDTANASPYVGSTVQRVQQWSDGVARPAQDQVFDVTQGSFDVTTRTAQQQRDSGLGVSSVPGRHLSLGSWSLSEAPLNPDGTRGVTNAWTTGSFVFGNRTASNDIPVSGTARYNVDFQGNHDASATNTRSTTLDVDFAAHSVAASYSRNLEVGLFPAGVTCCYGGDESVPDPATRIATLTLAANASGSAAISTGGSFDIVLAGAASLHTSRIDKIAIADQSLPVSGSISGAFFGPLASELGGSYILPNPGFTSPDGRLEVNEQAALYDTFIAVRSTP